MNRDRIKDRVLEDRYPSDEEMAELKSVYSRVSDLIDERFGVETHLAGSAGRGTCLSGDQDVDVFLLLPDELSTEELEEKGLEIGEEVFEELGSEYEVDYAEHPYTKGQISGFSVEIVPCFDLEQGELKSSVDRSPHHSEWVKENLDEEQKKDVVVLKAFLKANGLYGSSLKVEGFSGYLCEVLVAHFGGFFDTLESARHWEEETTLDPVSHHGGELPGQLDEKFGESPLRVIDPVDPERNVAAVLSTEKYAEFVYLARSFTKSPGMDFFEDESYEPTEFELKQEISDRADILVISFDSPSELADLVYPQMRKLERRLIQVLEKHSFRIFSSGFQVGEVNCRIILELEGQLPEMEKVEGPKVFHGWEHVDEFESRYDNTFIKGSRIYAKQQREFSRARELIDDFLTGNLKSKGVPKHLADNMGTWTFADPVVPDKEWLKFLGEYFNMEKKDG